jgi:hypothetical protein
LDFDVGFVSTGLLASIVPRLREMESSTRLRGAVIIFASEDLRAPLALVGAPCEVLPFQAEQLDGLKVAAAGGLPPAG